MGDVVLSRRLTLFPQK